MKKIVIILLIFCISSFAYADQYLAFSSGMNFFADNFPENSFKRTQYSLDFITSFFYYPNDVNFGLYTQAAIGTLTFVTESNARESMLARKGNAFEFRLIAAPSYRVSLGKRAYFPVSLGPVFLFTNEKTPERIYSGGGAITTDYKYQSINWGINGDFSFLISLSRNFFLRPGILMDFIFLRSEKGEMRMNYRTTHNNVYKGTPYNSFNIGFYFGLGPQF